MLQAKPRIIKRITVVAALATTLTGCGGGGSTSNSLRYAYQDITPQGQQCIAMGIDNQGDVLLDTVPGASGPGLFLTNAIIYSKGTFTDIRKLANVPMIHGLAMNQYGDVVYQIGQQTSPLTVGIYSGGTTTQLPPLTGSGVIVALSDSGLVLGNSVTGSQSTDFLFTHGSWVPLASTYFIASTSPAVGFDPNSNIIFKTPTGLQIFTSPVTSQSNYGLPAGGLSTTILPIFVDNHGRMTGNTQYVGSNGLDVIAGYSGTPSSGLPTLPSPNNGPALAKGQNNNGEIVGAADPFGKPTPLIWTNGQYHDLRGAAPFPSGSTSISASGINDSNEICGSLTMPDGSEHAFLLTPKA